MNFLRGLQLQPLRINVASSKIPLCLPEQKFFCIKSCMLNETEKATFTDKPLWLKKIKIKQAEMQKPDGLPVFLKRGFRDKVLFNIVVVGLFGGLFYAILVLNNLDKPYRNKK